MLIIINIIVINCGSPPDIINGTVDINRGTGFSSVAVYSCDVGFNLNGGAIISCQANETWTGPIPTCNSEKQLPICCHKLHVHNSHC